MQNEKFNKIYWQKKNIGSTLQDFIRIGTSEKYENTFLTFFKVEVYRVFSFFSV